MLEKLIVKIMYLTFHHINLNNRYICKSSGRNHRSHKWLPVARSTVQFTIHILFHLSAAFFPFWASRMAPLLDSLLGHQCSSVSLVGPLTSPRPLRLEVPLDSAIGSYCCLTPWLVSLVTQFWIYLYAGNSQICVFNVGLFWTVDSAS